MMDGNQGSVGEIIKGQRVASSLTLRELSTSSGISSSHLGRIERGERFPSAHVLRKIAKPLGFDEDELFTLAGYLSYREPAIAEANQGYSGKRIDPYVSKILAEEPIEIQRTVIGILNVLKSIAKSLSKEGGYYRV
ncbi:helix-turn-helix domain-containing protein [Chloroflexota bacterium]